MEENFNIYESKGDEYKEGTFGNESEKRVRVGKKTGNEERSRIRRKIYLYCYMVQN